MHEGRGYFRAKSGAYTHGCEQGNNHNASAIRPTDGPWWGEAKAKDRRLPFCENLVSIDTVCGSLHLEGASPNSSFAERDLCDSDKRTAVATALIGGGGDLIY